MHVLQPGTHKLGCSGGNDIVLHLLGLPVVVPLEKSQWILEWTRIVSMLEDPIKYANIPKKGVNVIIMKRKFGTSQRKCREEKYRKSVSFIDDPPHPSSKAR